MPDLFGNTFSLEIQNELWHCPKHGDHGHWIKSSIPGHDGVWCQVCWMEQVEKTCERMTPVNSSKS